MALTGIVIYRDHPLYKYAIRNWDLWTTANPFAVVYAVKPIDIYNAIKWSLKNNKKFRIRSGGHALGKDFSSVDDGIVISLEKFNDIKISPNQNIARVGTGIQVGQLVKNLAAGGYMFPFGDVYNVGIGGIAQGGGIGLLQKKMGLILDNIVGYDIVTTRGEIKVNSNKNSDLYWALRGGGGGNFGVVTHFYIKLKKAPKTITLIKINWTWDSTASDFVKKLLSEWQNWIKTLDDNMTTSLEILNKTANRIILTGLYFGDSNTARNILEPIIGIDQPQQIDIRTLPYAEMLDRLLNPIQPTTYNQKFTSFWVADDDRQSCDNFKDQHPKPTSTLPVWAINDIVSFLETQTGASDFYCLDWGGTAKNPSPKSTAFYWRKVAYYFEFSITWNKDIDDESAIEPLDQLRRRIEPFTVGAYVNVPDNAIQNYGEKYYGLNYERLRSIKTKWDPCNIFRFAQSIKPLHK